MSVVYPSLGYTNALYFRSAYNVRIVVDDSEPEERLLNRFRREVMRAGVIQECKRWRFFENKQDERQRKTIEAAKRNSRRRRFQFTPKKTKLDKKPLRPKRKMMTWGINSIWSLFTFFNSKHPR